MKLERLAIWEVNQIQDGSELIKIQKQIDATERLRDSNWSHHCTNVRTPHNIKSQTY